MLNFLIALAVQPIFIIFTKFLIELAFFIYDEVCCIINNLKREVRQAIWDFEWQYKLFRKALKTWHLRSSASEVIMKLMMLTEILYVRVTHGKKLPKR